MRPSFFRPYPLLIALVVVLGLALLLARPVFAAAGIWESYIVLNGTFYDVNAATGNPNFPAQNLGTFVSGSIPLTLSGGFYSHHHPVGVERPFAPGHR